MKADDFSGLEGLTGLRSGTFCLLIAASNAGGGAIPEYTCTGCLSGRTTVC